MKHVITKMITKINVTDSVVRFIYIYIFYAILIFTLIIIYLYRKNTIYVFCIFLFSLYIYKNKKWVVKVSLKYFFILLLL